MFDHQNGTVMPSPHWPSGRCWSSRRDPHPSDATRARSPATISAGEVAHDLPADGGIRVEQPVDHRI
jgi:hypothetical protein